MAKRQKVKRFSIQTFDAAHYKQTEQYTQAVDALFDRATNEIARAAAKGEYDPDKPFSFDDYPSVKAVMQSVTKQLASRVTTVIESGSKKQWLFACNKNDGFISSIMDTSKLSKAQLKKMQDQNLDALKTFQGRKVEGMSLSQRVWKYVGQYREQLEAAIDAGLGEGRSAAQLSRDVRQNLRDPNRLFRRVRDKRGNLVLSKAAKAFHPGQGVYRSSAKNAARLTRSEINMAYRESDYLRWQKLDFVVGFEVKRSNHEPLCDCDICEKLKGRYPKHFKFKGWHPQCMCYAVPILTDFYSQEASDDRVNEMRAALYGKEYKKYVPKETVVDVPEGFKEWVKDHIDAQQKWGSTPYFIRDNFKDGKLSKGLKFDTQQIDPVQQQLDQLKPQISSIRTLCNEWGLNTFILDDAIQNRNPSGVVNAISVLRSRVDAAIQEYKNFIADATEAVKEARKYNIDVSDMLSLISSITSDKREWIMTKASCKKTLVDFKEKIWKAVDDAKNNNSAIGKYDNTRADNEDEIEKALGIKKATAMNHQDANESRGNPNYAQEYIPDHNGRYRDRITKELFSKNPKFKKKFTINCQSCVVAYEMRRRGFDVQAVGNTANSIPRVLSHHTELAWLDDNGNTPKSKEVTWVWDANKDTMVKSMIANLDKMTKEVGRYHIKWTWGNARSGHIITCERLANGKLRIYDPQNGKEISNLSEYGKGFLHNSLKVLRVDNLRFNPLYAGCLKGNKRPKKK